ncbi:hypothetical protein R1sor_006330 [Riccia sorocarpa]|uniref:Uncharacterized protein n=1 Tax=Riccia sorocarpa TaxID=122646 RepID=A0ABD3HQD9_9MARC
MIGFLDRGAIGVSRVSACSSLPDTKLQSKFGSKLAMGILHYGEDREIALKNYLGQFSGNGRPMVKYDLEKSLVQERSSRASHRKNGRRAGPWFDVGVSGTSVTLPTSPPFTSVGLAGNERSSRFSVV